MRTNNVIRNIICTLLNRVICTVFPFAVRTYTIKCLGSEYMGLNNLCASILSILVVSDLGVANAFAFRLYKPIAQRNKEEICRLLNFYRKVYTIIGMVILGMGMIILPFFKCFISQNIPDGINVYIVFFIYLINTVISYVFFAYKNLIFIADQRQDYDLMITSIMLSLLYTSQILLVSAHKYYISVVTLPLCTFIGNLIRNIIALHKYPEYIPSGKILESEKEALKKDIFSVAVYKCRDISRNTFDNVIISTCMGLVILSNYQNYNMVAVVATSLISIIYTSVLPSLGNFSIMHDVRDVYSVYKKIAFIMSILSGWFAMCYLFLIQDFIEIWLGREFKLSWKLAVLFSVYIYLYGEVLIIKIMRESIGLWNQGRVWAVVEMLTNLVLNIVLAVIFGVEGIILATIISILFISVLMENNIIFNQYFKGFKKDKVIDMIVNALWTVITAVIIGILCHFSPLDCQGRFIYKICVCALIPPLSCMLYFRNKEEFKVVKGITVKLIKKMADMIKSILKLYYKKQDGSGSYDK